MFPRFAAALSVSFALLVPCLKASEWSRFRGPNGSGVADTAGLPVAFGDGLNMAWKVPAAPGKSSPVLTKDRIFLTAHQDDNRLVLAFDRETGKPLWRRSIEKDRGEARNDLNDPAAPSPVSDRENVYAFFSEVGLVSYGPDGNRRWLVPLGPFDTEHGMSTSPLYVDGKIVLMVDQIGDSYLVAFNAADGSVAWKVEKPSVLGGYATPVLYRPDDGPTQIVGISPVEAAAYSAETGKRLWWVNGLAYQSRSSPVVGDGMFFANSSGLGPGPGAPFERMLQWADKDKDGKISLSDLNENSSNRFMPAMLRRWAGDDGALDAEEYGRANKAVRGDLTFLAIGLGGSGDITETHVRWRLRKGLPQVSTPLLYDRILYLIKNGGIVTALDAQSGKILKQGRIREAIDKYYSSPVASDGKIYIASETGKVAVLKAAGEWDVLRVNDLGEDIYATPALAGGRIYLRTAEHLYCFERHELITSVGEGDVASVRDVLAGGGVAQKTIDLALAKATEAGQVEISKLLRDAGVSPISESEDAVLSAERLEAYAGEFKNERGWKQKVVFEDGILLYSMWGGESRLHPESPTVFRIREKTAIVLTFDLEEDRVVGFTVNHPDWPPATFKRVEE